MDKLAKLENSNKFQKCKINLFKLINMTMILKYMKILVLCNDTL